MSKRPNRKLPRMRERGALGGGIPSNWSSAVGAPALRKANLIRAERESSNAFAELKATLLQREDTRKAFEAWEAAVGTPYHTGRMHALVQAFSPYADAMEAFARWLSAHNRVLEERLSA